MFVYRSVTMADSLHQY